MKPECRLILEDEINKAKAEAKFDLYLTLIAFALVIVSVVYL